MRWVALLRGINVGGATSLPMAGLRELCVQIGWRDVGTYIQSGNVLFEADGAAGELEAALEQGLERRFGMSRAVIVRSSAQWADYAAGSPFPDAEANEPNRLMLCLSKAAPAADAAARLQERAAAGERIERRGDAIWVHYPAGAGNSKLSPSLFDRATGSPVTARNWRTVLKLRDLLGD